MDLYDVKVKPKETLATSRRVGELEPFIVLYYIFRIYLKISLIVQSVSKTSVTDRVQAPKLVEIVRDVRIIIRSGAIKIQVREERKWSIFSP